VSDNAKICPCRNCKSLKADKESPSSVCYNCEERILYDLSLTDPRLIPKYFQEDIDRMKMLEKVKITEELGREEKSNYTPTWQINKKLDRLAEKNGFPEGYLPWLKYLRNEKRLTITAVAKLCKTNYTVIRIRLKNNKPPYDSRRIIDYEDRYCQFCGKLLVRKRYDPPNKKRMKGVLESNERFLKRRYCDRKCSARDRFKSYKGEKNDNNN